MSIEMKTYYFERNNDNVNEVLNINGINDFNTAFEFIFKDLEGCTKKCNNNMDFVLMKTTMTSLTRKKINSSITLTREKCEKYIVMFVNIKNENGDNFSSFVDTLNENDKMIIIDGVILKNNTTMENNVLTVAVRLENKSSVFLFRLGRIGNLNDHPDTIQTKKKYDTSNDDKLKVKSNKYKKLNQLDHSNTNSSLIIKENEHSKNTANNVHVSPHKDFLSSQHILSKNNTDTDLYINNTNNNKLNTLNETNEDISNENQLHNELNKCTVFNKIPTNFNNLNIKTNDLDELTNIETNERDELTTKSSNQPDELMNMSSSDDNINVSPCKDIYALQQIHNNQKYGLSQESNLNMSIEKNKNFNRDNLLYSLSKNISSSTHESTILRAVGIPNTQSNNVNLNNNNRSTIPKVNQISIEMKTYYFERNNDNVNEILNINGINYFNNAFELIFKDLERCTKKCNNNMDFVLMKTTMTSLKRKKINSSITLSREKCEKYIVMFVNIKNENGDNFSSFVDTLNENDKIIIIDGVILKNNTTMENNVLTVAVRLENKSSAFLFKCRRSIMNTINLWAENTLSNITGSGYYSLFGLVKKTIKYTDEKYMLLRIQCHDECSIKIHKYPHSADKVEIIASEELKYGIKYDLFSNKVDIIIRKPSNDFIALKPNQKILLNNVKVSYSHSSCLFSLYLKGRAKNLISDHINIDNKNEFNYSNILCQIDHQFENVDNETDGERTPVHIICTPSFLTDSNKSTSLMTQTFNTTIQSNVIHLTNAKAITKTKRIGPCSLIHTDPNVYSCEDGQDFISEYCPNCCSFFVKSSLIGLYMKNRCPVCLI